MRQKQWLKLIKDYDLKISYHPGKANIVADAFSCKRKMGTTITLTSQKHLLEDIGHLDLEIILGSVEAWLAS